VVGQDFLQDEEHLAMRSSIIHLPFGAGRLLIAHESRDGAAMHAGAMFTGHLRADLFRCGKHQGHRDLGSGLVTNIGTLALAGDSQWPQTSIVTNLFKLLKYHASGKGVTAATIHNIKIETDSTVGGQTPIAGTQVFTHDQTGTVQKWVSIATIAYTGAEAVTEWGIFNASTLLLTPSGTPLTAVSANTFTGTGSVYTASAAGVLGLSQAVIETTTTPRYGLITSNTTNVGTLSFGAASGWMVSTTSVIGSTPGGTEAITLKPVMWDHKVFSAINVANLDSIQFTYTLTISSGG
jgi:hypothetical protein